MTEPNRIRKTLELSAPWSRSHRRVPTYVIRPAQEFLKREAAGGIILLLATIAALVWANVATSSYSHFWERTLSISIGGWGHEESLRHVVNDGLMAIFFFVIGLEVKRELVVGELKDRRAALVPMFAALGGMIMPAAIFLLLTQDAGDALDGWGVPMATDIAFALGVLALLGSRIPPALKVLLLAIAVIDDIGAIVVIAVFYSGSIEWSYVLAGVACIVLIRVLSAVHVRSAAPYVALGIALWLATYESGIHATIAGVILGLMTPARPFQRGDAVSIAATRIADITQDEVADPDKDAASWRQLAWLSREAVSPLYTLEHGLHPWTSFIVLPLFALANVGIAIDLDALTSVFSNTLGAAVIAGLVIGKPAGVVLGTAIAVRSGLGVLPDGVGWRHICGIGALAGIGFTMSLFITTLAFTDSALIQTSTIAVLVGSIISGAIGATILVTRTRVEPTA